MNYRIESLMSARLFVAPQYAFDRVYFLSNLSGHLSLYAMFHGGSVPEPLLPPHIALQNPHLIGGHSFYVFPEMDKILVMIDKDGDENYQPMLIPLDGGFPEPAFNNFFAKYRVHLDVCDRAKGIVYLGAERRDKAEVAHLHSLAEKVRLLEAETEWHELWTHSSRKGRKTPLSGFTGTAVYRTDNWEPLLPWLIWGQAIQTGKSAVKGNGVYQLAGGDWPHYWDWMQSESLVEA